MENPWPKEVGNARRDTVRVHILHLGKALCRFVDKQPRHWPRGHLWVRMGSEADCPGCLATRDEIIRQGTSQTLTTLERRPNG